MKILISTFPFAHINKKPIQILKKANVRFDLNPLGRKLTESELSKIIKNYDGLIAGTEKISKKVLMQAKKLKIISRVGSGLDSVDLREAKKKNILVSYTPNAPSKSVAELSLANILTSLRSIHTSNLKIRRGIWYRHFGESFLDAKVGIIGAGRIGKILIRYLMKLGFKKIYVNDIKKTLKTSKIKWVSKNYIYQNCNVISLHLPLTKKTHNLISKYQFKKMKKNTILLNTSRGGIINEKDLFYALKRNQIHSAAIDVFETEPYYGPLAELDNCLLTAHMGSMSKESRFKMEIESTEEVIRFIKGKKLLNLVPENEYNNLI